MELAAFIYGLRAFFGSPGYPAVLPEKVVSPPMVMLPLDAATAPAAKQMGAQLLNLAG